MSLHDATGDDAFLRRTESLVRAAERLMGQVVPQDYIAERDRWTQASLLVIRRPTTPGMGSGC